MDLSSTYLGLRLPHPLIVGASPMADDLDLVKRLEDAGAAAITLRSLFEEQLVLEQLASNRARDLHTESFAEATSFLPEPVDYALGPDEYLEQLRRIKASVSIPVIASLNGHTDRGWLEYARLMEQAGASAIELNVYSLETDPERPAAAVEQDVLDMLHSVRRVTRLPLALKLSPFYTALPHFARRAVEAGADGLVLFNRFYQPDIDIEELEVAHTLHLSDSSELLLRLRWLAILSGRVPGSLAVTGGVHSATDVMKSVMAGAHGVQMVSALLRHGPSHLRAVIADLGRWLDEHEYESLSQACGSMSLERCPDPAAYERGNYMRMLHGWHDPIPQ